MKIITKTIKVETKGAGDLRNITDDLRRILEAAKLNHGSMTVFVTGSTASIITFEYEPGMIRDVKELFEKLVPSGRQYAHDETWGDANGFSHLRAMLTGPSLVIPFEDGKLLLGTWQQVVLAEFDTRSRQRVISVQCAGE